MTNPLLQPKQGLSRRTFLRGALASAAVFPLAACAATSTSTTTTSSSSSAAVTSGPPASSGGASASTTAGSSAGGGENPFNLSPDATVDAVIFNGGYGYDYVTFAADVMKKKNPGVTINVTPSTQIAQQLQPRFVGGNPPDLIDNSGANAIGFSSILSQLSTLDDVFEANNYEGQKISDTLYPGVKTPGTFGDKFVAMNYVLTVYGLWYSASLFQENGWTPPKTWADLQDLGAKAKAKGKYLFVWGKEAATYYLTLAIGSAVKEGGLPVLSELQNLKPNAWSQKPVQDVFTAMYDIVKAGYFVPGGAGTQFTAAQAQWSNDQKAIIYPSGSWIENEMKKATKAGFEMTGIPEPTVTAGSKLPQAALHSAAGEPFIVPSNSKDPAGGRELMRAMLSKDAATNFAKTKLTPTIVKGLVPADGFGSTALVSQSKMLDAAGSDVFDFQFINLYGMNTDQLVVWNTFLSGGTDVAGLTSKMQEISDKVASDSSVTKVTFP